MKNLKPIQEQLSAYGNYTKSPYVLLEAITPDKHNYASYFFRDFNEILTFKHGDNLQLFFEKIERYLKRGYWAVGYFAYEFGYYLEPALYSLQAQSQSPLAWFGLSGPPSLLAHSKTILGSNQGSDLSYAITNIQPNISETDYYRKIQKIKFYLEEGLTYQVNFTFKVKFDFRGNPLDLYMRLRQAQPTAYTALIHTGKDYILSHSPELFFRIDKDCIKARPMKGTIQRGLTLSDDQKLSRRLQTDKKTQAENLMIVDLLRNDLGRIARKVWVPELFCVEKYRSLYQMTSTIKAKLYSNLRLTQLFCALFPCGSVTGAPKIKTMEIIKELEKEPRGIYTGAIGYICPQKKACFNVAIRTIHLNAGKGQLGVGGGIVYDSQARDEYKEALLKAKFFISGLGNIRLIETMRYSESQGYFLLDLHLRRLKDSCEYFSIPLNTVKLKHQLRQALLNQKGAQRVRLLVDLEGRVYIETEPLQETAAKVKIMISKTRIHPNNVFLYHKTTQRDLYDKESRKAKAKGFFEVIYLNSRGELSEGATTNIFVMKNNHLYTPPERCGLLPGVLREHLLRQGKAKEKVLYLDDIYEADKVFVGNSLRGLMEVALIENQELKAIEKVQLSGKM